MLLLSPQRAALAMGTQCTRSDGVGDEQLLEQLRLLTPRIESVMGVRSLSRGAFVSSYVGAERKPGKKAESFRLDNGFIVPGSVSILGLYGDGGSPITAPDRLDADYGIVYVDYTSCDAYVDIAYTSGFVIPDYVDASTTPGVHPDPNYRVLDGIPDSIAGTVAVFLSNAYRNLTRVPNIPKERGSLEFLNEAMRRELRARVYDAYLRPRDGVRFSIGYAPA